MGEACVQADPRQHQAEAVRALNPHQMRSRSFQHCTLNLAAHACGDDDSRASAFASELLNEFGDGVRRSGDDPQVRRCGKCGERRIAILSVNRSVFWVHQPYGSREPAPLQTSCRNQADTARPVARADESDRAWLQQILQIADRHAGCSCSYFGMDIPKTVRARSSDWRTVPWASTTLHHDDSEPVSV